MFGQITVREALNSALKEEIERDPKVFLMGILFNTFNFSKYSYNVLNIIYIFNYRRRSRKI